MCARRSRPRHAVAASLIAAVSVIATPAIAVAQVPDFKAPEAKSLNAKSPNAKPPGTVGGAAKDAPVTSRGAVGPSKAPQADRPEVARSWLPRTGADLRALERTCRDSGPRTPPAMRDCYGYQAGVIVSALLFANRAGVDAPFCIPDGTTDAGLARTVSRFVDREPQAADYAAPAVIVAAMVSAYPCPADGGAVSNPPRNNETP